LNDDFKVDPSDFGPISNPKKGPFGPFNDAVSVFFKILFDLNNGIV